MSARYAKYSLLVAALIWVAFMHGWDVLGGCVLFVLGVAFGLLWERYSSEFSVLADRRKP